MRFISTKIPDVILIEPDVYQDERGFFLETFHATRYADAGIRAPFVQDNHSRSGRGVLRGLHSQRHHPQGKLIRCIEGSVFDVAVDARVGSPSFGEWVGYELSGANFLQLWVPPGFLHGFVVSSEVAQIEYKCTEVYYPDDELGVAWDDPEIGIGWPLEDPVLSEKDRRLPSFAEVRDLLPPFA